MCSNKQKVNAICNYPDCNCPLDHPGTKDWCAKGLDTNDSNTASVVTPMDNNGGKSNYYDLPKDAVTLNDLIDYKELSWNVANIFKAAYRLGNKEGVSKEYDLNKIIYYAMRELNLIKKGGAIKKEKDEVRT